MDVKGKRKMSKTNTKSRLRIQILLVVSVILLGLGCYFLTLHAFQFNGIMVFLWAISGILLIYCISASVIKRPKKIAITWILASIIIISMIVSSYFYMQWWSNNNIMYSYTIQLTPDTNGNYTVYVPVPLDSYNEVPSFMKTSELKIVETQYGKAFEISENKTIDIKKDGLTDDRFYKFSMYNESELDHWLWFENKEFWIYGNLSSEMKAIELNLVYTYDGQYAGQEFRMTGKIHNGWQLINGSCDSWEV